MAFQENTQAHGSPALSLIVCMQEDVLAMREGAAFLVTPKISALIARIASKTLGSRSLLQGAQNAGCSTALAAVVQWARTQGWVVRSDVLLCPAALGATAAAPEAVCRPLPLSVLQALQHGNPPGCMCPEHPYARQGSLQARGPYCASSCPSLDGASAEPILECGASIGAALLHLSSHCTEEQAHHWLPQV